MSWRAVVAALDEHAAFRSNVSLYLHPLAGRPALWHVVRALLAVQPAPTEILVLHLPGAAGPVDVEDAVPLRYEAVAPGDETRALRDAVAEAGRTLLVDGSAALVTPGTLTRLLRASEHAVASVRGDDELATSIAVAGEGRVLAAEDDPRVPTGAARVAPGSAEELLQVLDRHTLSDVSVALRDRLVRQHERGGVSFLLPATTWVDVDVRIGADTLVYPHVVLEGASDIDGECVIGPYTRIVDSEVGRGAELKGWNYLCRARLRSRAVLDAYARRSDD